MNQFNRIATLLAALTLFGAQAYGNDWSTILPPESSNAQQKEVKRQEKNMKVGEVATIPLPSSKSYTCIAEVDGDSVRIVSQDPFGDLIIQAAKPGQSTVKIFQKFWRDPDVRTSYVLIAKIIIQVPANTSRKILEIPSADQRQDIPAPRQTAAQDWEGSISRQSEELLTVITDDKAWHALWERAFDKPAPKVDFEKYAVACVFLGYQADWLYHIHIGEPAVKEHVMIIPYGTAEIILELSGAFRASGQYRMKAVEKKKGYGIIIERARKDGM